MASLGLPLPASSLVPSLAPALQRDQPIALALVGSGIVHALLAIAITMQLVTLPEPRPVPGTGADVRTVLQYAPMPESLVLPDPMDRLAAPTLAPLLVPLFVPLLPSEPAPTPMAVAPVAPLPAAPSGPATARLEPRVLDPNGSVTVGILNDAQQVSATIASAMADRYRTRPDRAPRLTAALIVPYPGAARRSRTSARITAVLDIDEHGRITATSLVPDDGIFAPAVVEALKEARFTPAEVAAHPVPYWTVLEFDFAISAR